jgi:phenylalanyl-tRNA synthetase beta chain
LLRKAELFDAFEGGKLPEGKMSLAVRVTYRSDERTLTEEDVTSLEKQILDRLAAGVDARLRDT